MIETMDISISKSAESRISQVDFNNLQFGKVYSDHMFIADYADGEWKDLRIVPYGDISISPANTTLHYASTIFEGLKANRSENGDILVFRPEANAKRMRESAERMCMPPVPEELFIGALDELLRLDSQWVPSNPGTSLYIRPFQLAMDPYVGIRPSDTYQFLIITCPVGAYYAEPVKVKIETHFTRAAKGGTGFAKTGGNYAAALKPAVDAQKEGRLTGHDKASGMLRILSQVLAGKVRPGDFLEIKRELRGRVDVQLTDDSRAVASALQATGQIRNTLAVETEIPGRESDLAVLVRVEPGQDAGPALAAARLSHKGTIEADPLRRKSIQVRGPGVRIAIATQFGTIVFRDNEEDVRRGGGQFPGKQNRAKNEETPQARTGIAAFPSPPRGEGPLSCPIHQVDSPRFD